MATRSTISAVITDPNGNKRVQKIYCHWDGYLDNNGKILLENYNTQQRVEELLFNGDMSVLGKYTEPNDETGKEKHTFDNPHPDVCVYYGRDRGEEGTEFKTYDNLIDYLNHCNFEEYNYIFSKGKWYYFENDNYKMIRELEDGLKKEESGEDLIAISKDELVFLNSK